MASKSFTLADNADGGNGNRACTKFCACTSAVLFVGILVAVGVYVYQTSYGSACSYPELDDTGLSNWTSGADYVAFACFPGFFLEGDSNLVVSKCEDGLWNPPTPACNALPLRLDCYVHNHSLTGNISMWQEGFETPTIIEGFINYNATAKPQGHVMEHILISKKTCNVSHAPRNSSDKPFPDESSSIQQKILRIKFNSTELKAFKKTELYMYMIFVDANKTATFVSVHQDNLSLVMTGSDTKLNSSWGWTKEAEMKRSVMDSGLWKKTM